MTLRSRSSLARSNDTLARHIQRGDRPKGDAPIAPMPEKPDTCRWCGGPLTSVLEFEPKDYCQRGCAKNDQSPFLLDCQECRRPFRTGRHGAVLCHGCDGRERLEFAEGHKGSGFRQTEGIYLRGMRERRGEE